MWIKFSNIYIKRAVDLLFGLQARCRMYVNVNIKGWMKDVKKGANEIEREKERERERKKRATALATAGSVLATRP